MTIAAATACTNIYAATFNVTKTADTNDGICNTDCSLREAVIAANNQPGADIINLPAGNYILTLSGINEDASATGDLDIKDDLTITGAGQNITIINGNQQDRVFDIFSDKTVLLTKLAINNGVTNTDGAGLRNAGYTTMKNVTFDGNVSGTGGAIESRPNAGSNSSLSIESGLFTNNCSNSGGAIDVVGGFTVKNSIFNGNRPVVKAGIDCKNGDGAAIHVQGSSGATIDSSTFINNVGHVGAITMQFGDLTVTNSTFTNNQGLGGQWSRGGAGAIHIQSGYPWGYVTLINSTIANNSAKAIGGGIDGVMTLKNTIIANNTAPLAGPDCYEGNTTPYVDPFDGTVYTPIASPPISNGNNIIGSTLNCNLTLASGDVVGNPGLSTVQTDTVTGHSYIPMLATSPALDGADNSACSNYDQLGNVRPTDGNGDGIAQCDIGAYEKQPIQTIADVCPAGCAHSSIQAAINSAASGATIKVGPGTYREMVSLDNSKTLISTSGASNTIIDATGLNTAVALVGRYSVLDGFTLTGGAIGAYARGYSTVRNNIIRGNAYSTGSGVYVDNNSPFVTIEGNTIESNTGTNGGIIYISGGNAKIDRNIVRNNTSSLSTIIIDKTYSYPSITNTLLTGNTVTAGNQAVIFIPSYSYPKLINNTITGNNAWGVGALDYSYATIENSIVWGNSKGDVKGVWGITNSVLGVVTGSNPGNIFTDPLFVGNGNYRLRSNSPAIDTGKNASANGVVKDLENIDRPKDGNGLGAGGTGDGSDYDIGAYEYH